MRSLAAVLPAIVLLAAAAAACGGAPAASSPVGPRPAPVTADAGAATSGGDTLASLDALAARGVTDAPLMREALRVDPAVPRSPDVRADKDVCLRAVFAASTAVRASFVDASGAPRGEATTSAGGAVPPRGPVCAKKGEALHLVVDGAEGTSARAVIFAAP